MEGNATPRQDRLDVVAIALVTLLCALWGVQQVTVKVAIAGGLPPLLQGTLRHAGAATLVACFVLVRQGAPGVRALFRRDAATWPGLLIAVLFALEFIALFPGLSLTTASRAVIFLYTAPFFTALGAHFFVPGERFRLRQVIGLLIAFAGVAATFADGLVAGGGSVTGDLLCLAGGAFWGATTVVVKASPGLQRSPPAKLLFFQLAGSAPMMLAVSLLAGEHVAWGAVSTLAWAGLFYQTVVVAFASYLAWIWLVLAYPAGRLAGFTFLTPLFGALAGALLLGEHVGLALLVGLAAIAVGLPLLNSKGRTP
jgi:drug/metabolite transporter (DMT)-like permease